ncbi:hypothetical protein A2863_02205 [Candidatus Woesebacteria bacterium RIFCSPHIGHO2_01_FULL_38_9b]|uniref:Alpha-2-macroglobulin domain-containing protein n=1 Tax=Candidatus Woesebacteria bacterium RIFCSPHIGHO2_01_FULL_38_9b TaxID=1802493 RepID=A0A1F7Y4K2_9BACT|nr:MAG: hypothetical protein A2863_02205 [Candidatus Woesebacteria bacterium RIFCSPHIGHO2_01_FULL_38_9b]
MNGMAENIIKKPSEDAKVTQVIQSVQNSASEETDKPKKISSVRKVGIPNFLIKLGNWLKSLTLRIWQKISQWAQTFKSAPREQKIKMVRIPVALALILYLIFSYGHYFLPPKITVSFPGNEGKGIPLDSKIEFQFDRSMNKKSVERNFSITPQVPGKIEWIGDAKFIFSPDEQFSIASKYEVKISSLVLSSLYIPKFIAQKIVFETLGHPVVILASPQTEAPVGDSPITVMFDRPMIPLTSADKKEEMLPAFAITPEVEGEGRWLGTTAYQFRVTKPLRNATTYTYRVAAGIKAKDAGELQEDAIFTFSSVRPRVMATSPSDNYDFAGPTASVSATFNLPVRLDSAKEALHLFRVDNEQKEEIQVDIRINNLYVGMYPRSPLGREVLYEAQIDSGLLSTEGENGLEESYSWRFKTAPFPRVVGTKPESGKEEIEEQHQIMVNFISPMSEKSFEGKVIISPTPERKPSTYFSSYQSNNNLSIGTYLSRSTNYTITIKGDVRDQYGVPLGEDYTFSFKTAPFKPSVSIVPAATYFASFNQEVVPRIVAKVVNVNEINYKLYKLKKEEFLEIYRIHYISQNYEERNLQSYNPSKHELVREWKETFEVDQNVPVNVITKVEKANGDKIEPGFYFLDARIKDNKHDNLVMVVSKTSLTLKTGPDQALVWAVNSSTGEVAKEMDIEIFKFGQGTLKNGKTNHDGVYKVDVNLRSSRERYTDYDNPIIAFAKANGDEAAVSDNWQDGIRPYDFGLPSYYDYQESDDYRASENLKIHIVLDRPIYRPGQTVYYKGVVRRDKDGIYELLDSGAEVDVKVSDSQGKEVFKDNPPLSSFGTFSGSFELSPQGSVGYYNINANILGNGFSQQFQVEEYRRPDFSVEVTTDKPDYTDKEIVDASIAAKFYFGSPVDRAPIKWTLTTQDFSYRWDKDLHYEFGDSDSYWYRPWWYYSDSNYFSGEKVSEGTGATDGNGNYQVQLPINISDKDTNQVMRLEAVVTDISNQAIANSKEFVIHQAGLHVGLKPEHYSGRSGQESRVEVVAVNIDGNELKDIPVKVSFYKRIWNYVREQDPDTEEFYWTNKPSDTFITETNVVTGEFGRAVASFVPPEGGIYRAVAEANDTSGRTTKSASYLWVSGYGVNVPQENHDRIVMVPDKEEYKIGDTADVTASLPYETMTGLITVERGSVYDYKVVKLDSGNQSFNVAISDRYSPNAFISGVFIKAGSGVKDPPQFKMGITEIRVDNPKTKVSVDITTNKERFSPGEEMNVTLGTKDATGANVKTEVAIALVDEAVWSLARVQLADIHETFYRPRNLSILTANDLTISMDRINANINLGAKGGSGGGGGDGGPETAREKFLDTAYWNAHIETGDDGKAQFKVKLPDNLTTWRLIGIAVSKNTAVGDAVKKVLVTKDVLIQPLIPRFLSVGDKPKLGMVIHNNTSAQSNVAAEISLQGIKVLGQPTKTVSLAANTSQKIYWDSEVESVSEAEVLLKAQGGGFSDSVKIKIPVVSYYTPEVVATSGEAKDVGDEKLFLPKEIVPDQGNLSINLSPTLGTGVQDAASFLLSFPYYCSEQIINRVIPAVSLLALAKETGIEKIGGYEKDRLNEIVLDGIQRLINFQRPDGGWGWWSNYESSPYLTTLVVSGLIDAKEEDFTVPEKTIDQALEYLKREISKKDNPLETQAYITSVYARAKDLDPGILNNLMDKRWQMDELGRAYLLRALQEGGGTKKDTLRLMDEMISLTKKTNTTAHWELVKRNWYTMSGNVTFTSVMLEAIISQNPRHPFVADTTRWLMQARYDGHWQTTQETSAAVHAIVRMLKARSEGKPNENWQILIDNILKKEGKFEEKDLMSQISQEFSLADIPKEKDISVKINRSGKGTLYYNMNLKYFLPFEEVEPLDQGIVVIREFVNRNGKVMKETELKAGDELWVRLIILTPAMVHHVIVEDKLPAGLEAVNESLATSSLLNVERLQVPKDREVLYFRHNEIRDDRVVLFAETLPTGVYEYTYRVRPTTPGRYHHPPAQAYNMYIPDISGHSSGGWMEVRE